MKALIVEDDIVSGKTLAKRLSSYGNVNIVSTVQEALTVINAALILKDPYNLICLDIGLPDAEGFLVLRKLRDLEMSVGIPVKYSSKILMITGDDTASTVLKAFREGCDGFIKKPISKNKLNNTLKKLGIKSERNNGH